MSRLNPTISLAASGNFSLTFQDSAFEGARAHSIEIPSNEKGLQLIKHILQLRERGQYRIGQMGNPTQHMVAEWLKASELQKKADFSNTFA